MSESDFANQQSARGMGRITSRDCFCRSVQLALPFSFWFLFGQPNTGLLRQQVHGRELVVHGAAAATGSRRSLWSLRPVSTDLAMEGTTFDQLKPRRPVWRNRAGDSMKLFSAANAGHPPVSHHAIQQPMSATAGEFCGRERERERGERQTRATTSRPPHCRPDRACSPETTSTSDPGAAPVTSAKRNDRRGRLPYTGG